MKYIKFLFQHAIKTQALIDAQCIIASTLEATKRAKMDV